MRRCFSCLRFRRCVVKKNLCFVRTAVLMRRIPDPASRKQAALVPELSISAGSRVLVCLVFSWKKIGTVCVSFHSTLRCLQKRRTCQHCATRSVSHIGYTYMTSFRQHELQTVTPEKHAFFGRYDVSCVSNNNRNGLLLACYL
jgi:hypothetical protein